VDLKPYSSLFEDAVVSKLSQALPRKKQVINRERYLRLPFGAVLLAGFRLPCNPLCLDTRDYVEKAKSREITANLIVIPGCGHEVFDNHVVIEEVAKTAR